MIYTLDSGAELNVTVSSFDDASDLRDAILAAAKTMKLSEDVMNMDINVVIGGVLEAATSKEVKASLFKCFNRCTYNNLRLTKELFDDPKIGPSLREDYYEICLKVAEVNCLPFFKRAVSLWKGLARTLPGTQESIPGSQKSS